MLTAAVPFLLHALTELIASSTFLLSPSSHIPSPSSQATLVSHLLGGALIHSALTGLIFAFRDVWDDTARRVALAFGLWHLFPCYRAVARIRTGMGGKPQPEPERSTLGGPVLHLGVHGGLLVLFIWSAAQ
ncbi:uncharacterized protein DNG_02060 [Cephalotrichum gorgonifer]|uniref:Uncharacterized protein n=1 Tax=Cephalotrichum gorgonifer TaxID=2041049 RepID=A0AAE8MSQ1_9PEZI|nr:uncharacterized protein DNG_02060 [Cephalotrichum gorgonifer]